MRNLDAWMKSNGLNDDAVSKMVGVSRVQVSRIRRGLSGTRPPIAEKLADLTDIPAWDFITPAKQ